MSKNQYEGWSEEEKAVELNRLIDEQAKDDKRRHILPQRISRKQYVFPLDPRIIDSMPHKNLHIDTYYGTCKDDI